MKHIQQTRLAALSFALALVAGSLFQSGAADTGANAPESAIVTKAKRILLPEFKLDGVTLEEAVNQLQIAAKQPDPGNGINFAITMTATTAANPKITLALKNVTVKEAVERIAKAAGVRVTALDYAFLFEAKSDKP
jgi:hypothetical protein